MSKRPRTKDNATSLRGIDIESRRIISLHAFKKGDPT